MPRKKHAQHPSIIPSLTDITTCLQAHAKPVPLKRLIAHFQEAHGEALDASALEARLNTYCEREVLQRTRKGYQVYPDKAPVAGWISLDKSLEVWVIPENGAKRLKLEGIPDNTLLFPGDVVTVKPTSVHVDVAYAEFLSLDKAASPQIIGTYGRANKGPGHWIEPQHMPYKANHYPIRITEIVGDKPQHGQWVCLEVDRKNSHHWSSLEGKITQVIGDPQTPGFEVEAACLRFDLPHTWPEDVEKACEKFSSGLSAHAKRGREDIRDLPLVTIDGEDAKDFDDAVFCEPLKRGGWRLIVAIADVSHYVKQGSALDNEAQYRGTSVYFPGSVIPMLPEVLSNNLCSLKPHVDRLCMVCEMHITRKGKLSSYRFYEGLMHSHARLTYTQAQAILDGDARERQAQSHVLEPLEHLHALFRALIYQREKRGAIDFDTQEAKIYLNTEGEILKIAASSRQTSHRIIEECMLCANVAAADFLSSSKVPALYRVHASPPEDKLMGFRQFVGGLALKFPARAPKTKDFMQLLTKVKGTPSASVLQMAVLRCMSQAIYTTENEGHFGLAYDAYAHFTSPIRRYPDLLVHRTIRALLRQDQKTLTRLRDDPQWVEKIALESSMTERRAEEASRDVEKAYKCRYAEKHLGGRFEGTVVSVTHFGLFVQLDELLIDGLIHISALGEDYFLFEEDKQQLIGEMTQQTFNVGDKLSVVLKSVDVEERKVDFALMNTSQTSRRSRPSKKRHKKSKRRR